MSGPILAVFKIPAQSDSFRVGFIRQSGTNNYKIDQFTDLKKFNETHPTQMYQKNQIQIFKEWTNQTTFKKEIKEILNKSTALTVLTNLAGQGGSSKKKYIKLKSGGKRLIHYGSKGGRYYMKGGNKVYLKK